MEKMTLDELRNGRWYFKPENAEQSLLIQERLFNLGFSWNINKYPDHLLRTRSGFITGGFYLGEKFLCDHAIHDAKPCHYEQLPEPPLDPRMARLFNALADKDAVIAEQSAIIQKQSQLLEKIYEEIKMNKGFGFNKGMK